MATSNDQKVPEYQQLLGADLTYQVDFNDWLNDQGLSGSNATASVVNGTSVTLSNQSFASGIWSGLVTAASAGTSTVEVVLTPSTGSQRRHRRFCVEVTDPTCS